MLGFIKALLRGEAHDAPPLTPPTFSSPIVPPEDSPATIQPAPGDEDHPLFGRALIIDYIDAQDVASFRRISVRNCYASGNYSYVAARCLERQAHRVFRIDRIDSVACGVSGEDLGDPERFFVPAPPAIGSRAGRLGRKPLPHPELRAAIRALITVARADGFIHPSERQVIQSFLKVAGASLSEAERGEMLQRALGLNADCEAFYRNLRIMFQAGEPLASTTIAAMGDLARADGEVSDDEMFLVSEMIRKGKEHDYRITIE
ncbi:hypothetical protein CA606_18390 [Caulobacter vibrioides]|uniref:Uncharacterized protein n=1 Tax=Caulobacter vibrioides TaxID=155892 RepID=A0A290MQ54_CAUVI|nr:TerB family tellurite resistance protein [Caulobacter vibrioides]ATC34142.1 hypothetical protein CA606_18390 [Caulobacter vibrioides]